MDWFYHCYSTTQNFHRCNKSIRLEIRFQFSIPLTFSNTYWYSCLFLSYSGRLTSHRNGETCLYVGGFIDINLRILVLHIFFYLNSLYHFNVEFAHYFVYTFVKCTIEHPELVYSNIIFYYKYVGLLCYELQYIRNQFLWNKDKLSFSNCEHVKFS